MSEGSQRGTEGEQPAAPLCWEEAGLGTTQGPATSHQHRLSPSPWVKKYTRGTSTDGQGCRRPQLPATAAMGGVAGGGVLNEKERRGGMPGCNWLSGRVLVSAQVLISRS